MSPQIAERIADAAVADSDWLLLMERREAVAKMPRKQLEAHLALRGWYPVPSTRAALQNGNRRVFVIELPLKGKVTAGQYAHPTTLARSEVPGDSISDEQLRLLADKVEGLP